MALIVVLVLLTIAIAAVLTFGDAATLPRSLGPFRFLHPRSPRARGRPAAARPALTAVPVPPSAATTCGPLHAESTLVAQRLAGQLSRRDYQQLMALLAAGESTRRARP